MWVTVYYLWQFSCIKLFPNSLKAVYKSEICFCLRKQVKVLWWKCIFCFFKSKGMLYIYLCNHKLPYSFVFCPNKCTFNTPDIVGNTAAQLALPDTLFATCCNFTRVQYSISTACCLLGCERVNPRSSSSKQEASQCQQQRAAEPWNVIQSDVAGLLIHWSEVTTSFVSTTFIFRLKE